MTALALVGIVLFAVALVVIATATVRKAVQDARRGLTIARLRRDLHVRLVWRDKPVEDVFTFGPERQPDARPRPRASEPDVPPGWGFD